MLRGVLQQNSQWALLVAVKLPVSRGSAHSELFDEVNLRLFPAGLIISRSQTSLLCNRGAVRCSYDAAVHFLSAAR